MANWGVNQGLLPLQSSPKEYGFENPSQQIGQSDTLFRNYAEENSSASQIQSFNNLPYRRWDDVVSPMALGTVV